MFVYDEFELELKGVTYYINVEVEKYEEDEIGYTEIKAIKAWDEWNHPVDEESEEFQLIREECVEREYHLEIA